MPLALPHPGQTPAPSRGPSALGIRKDQLNDPQSPSGPSPSLPAPTRQPLQQIPWRPVTDEGKLTCSNSHSPVLPAIPWRRTCTPVWGSFCMDLTTPTIKSSSPSVPACPLQAQCPTACRRPAASSQPGGLRAISPSCPETLSLRASGRFIAA